MKITYLNGLRVLAALSVVFLHTSSSITDREVLAFMDKVLLFFYVCVLQFSVPLFVMISGVLFLNPAKDTSYKSLWKYVRRILLVLIVFALPMSAMELGFPTIGGGNSLNVKHFITDTLLNWVTGHSWNHMWYLYMLPGLYLITPLIKPFVVKATNTELKIILCVLFVLSSLMPTIEKIGLPLKGYMIISSPYIFIYILGYYLHWRASSPLYKNKWILSFIILACVCIIIWKCYNGLGSYGYSDPLVIVMAAAIFLMFKSFNVNSRLANKLVPYCFGVYIVHLVFINIAYKILKVDASVVVPFYNWIGLGLLFTLLSIATTHFLLKIPLLKKYVL
ncbi:MAG: acyltransferase [Prevotella sp.]|nr:acyltransferase [Prevotella sp.]